MTTRALEIARMLPLAWLGILAGCDGGDEAPDGPRHYAWTVEPGEFAEVDVELTEGATMTAHFEADAALAWNVHSHPGAESTIHVEGRDSVGSPPFTADAAGLYSYLWLNEGNEPVKLTVELSIEGMGRVDSAYP